MELMPAVYRFMIRPSWFTKHYIKPLMLKEFDFSNKFVLEFGCGVGTNSKMFRPHQYLGVDCDTKRIKYASRLFHHYDFATIDGPSIPLPNKAVDYVIIISVLHHIPTDFIPEYLEEFKRLLKDNGKVVIMEPCFHDHSDFCNTLMGFFDKGKYIKYENGYLSLFKNNGYSTSLLKTFSQLCLYRKILFSAVPVQKYTKRQIHA